MSVKQILQIHHQDGFCYSDQERETQENVKNKISIDVEVDTTQLQEALNLIQKINKELDENNKHMKESAINLLVMSLDKEKVQEWTSGERLDVLTFLEKNCLNTNVNLENISKY